MAKEYPLQEKSISLQNKEQLIFSRALAAYINHSGGAIGADFAWDQIGREYGVIRHYHYWYKKKTPYGNIEISKADAFEGQQKSTIAAQIMGRITPSQQIQDTLIFQNWAQVKYSETVFAIGQFIEEGEKLNYGKIASIRQVSGGTGYTVQMAIIENKIVFVFDQEQKQWYKNENGSWSKSDVPILTKNFAGIGTRKINEYGIEAIHQVYKKTYDLLNS